MPRKKGFTLVELSIVLTIIGLLVGAVIVSRSLIRQSMALSIIKEVNGYKSAFYAFYNKYNSYPGDISNATSYWTGGVTSNGNNDGIVTNGGTTTGDEAVLMWQHLSLSGFISGNYSGTRTAASTTSNTSGTNVPASKVAPNYYSVWHQRFFDDVLVNSIYITSSSLTTMTPLDAQIIDSKLDDSVPKSGTVRSKFSDDAASTTGTGGGAGTSCVIGSSNTYNLTSSTANCEVEFVF
jgi:prepilin-type N-terminal cleavage/methylation domain-containing protein